MAKNKKPFFFKRWMNGLSNLLEDWLFPAAVENETTVSKSFWYCLLSGFLGGIIMMIVMMVNGEAKGGKVDNIGSYMPIIIAAVLSLVFIVLHIVKSLPQYEDAKSKILRGVFVFFWCLIGFGLGVLLGYMAFIAIILLIIIWFIWNLIFGSNGSSGRKWKLDNGDEVSEKKGLLGEKYYESKEGKEYEKVDDNTFEEK